ncbi:MAG: hypothetical protein AAF251_06275 [Pseudomonadota bacterium]
MLPDLQIALIQFFFITLMMTVLAALVWGGMPSEETHASRSRLRRALPFDPGLGPERLAALVLVYMAMVQVGATYISLPKFAEVDASSLLVDVIGLTCFGTLAINSTRWWTLLPASFQLIAVLSHFPRLPMPTELFGEFAYALMKSGATQGAILCVLVGIFQHQARIWNSGPYNYWRDPDFWRELARPTSRQPKIESSEAIKGVVA